MATYEPKIVHDEPADVLYIAFYPGESATGLSLSEHILLRVNIRDRRAIGITLIGYSDLTNPGETGPRSFPLTRLDELTTDSRELAMGTAALVARCRLPHRICVFAGNRRDPDRDAEP